jgi:hypothetical protein
VLDQDRRDAGEWPSAPGPFLDEDAQQWQLTRNALIELDLRGARQSVLPPRGVVTVVNSSQLPISMAMGG